MQIWYSYPLGRCAFANHAHIASQLLKVLGLFKSLRVFHLVASTLAYATWFKGEHGRKLKDFKRRFPAGHVWFTIFNPEVPGQSSQSAAQLEREYNIERGLFDDVTSIFPLQNWDPAFDREFWSL